MAETASQGVFTKLCAEPAASPHTFDTSSEPIDFLRFGVRKVGTVVVPQGIRGTRTKPKERSRQGPYFVAGTFAVNPSPAFLDLWLPRILGGTETADDFPTAETLPSFGLMAYMDDFGGATNRTFEFNDCQVNRAMLVGRNVRFMDNSPQPVQLIIEVFAKTFADDDTAYPSLTLGTAANDAPYIFEDCESGLTLQSSARQTMGFELLIHNHLDVRHVNSLTATSIRPRDRTVKLKAITPATQNEFALFDQTHPGAAGTLVLTNGNMSTTFTFGMLTPPALSPTIEGKQEILLELDNWAFSSSTTPEINVTHDSTA